MKNTTGLLDLFVVNFFLINATSHILYRTAKTAGSSDIKCLTLKAVV
jgi:hypothetical protein